MVSINQNFKYQNQIVNGDSIAILKEFDSSSVHLVLSDIPYGIGIDDWDVLHDNTNSAYLGSSPAQEKAGAIFKKRGKPLNGWSGADRLIPVQYYLWCMSWAKDWLRILKPGGSAIVFAGRRLSHRCISAFEDVGFTYKDMISWVKDRAPHRAQRLSVVYERRGDCNRAKEWEGWRVGNLRPLFEPILWFTKPYEIGGTIADNMIENEVGAYNEDGFVRYNKHPDNIIMMGSSACDSGLHPTQKPLRLMQTLIELTTKEGQVVLDPFCGSGTTTIAAYLLRRKYIGIELNQGYCHSAQKRLEEAKQHNESDLFLNAAG
jgi:site-specific DNA-methyltransferase (adenine-specific)